MKTTFSKRYNKLHEGAHVVIVPNNQTSSSLTLTSVVAATCKLIDLPYVCVSYKGNNSVISKSISSHKFCLIDPGSEKSVNDEFSKILHQGRTNNAVIILDTTLGDSFDAKALLKTLDLRRHETVSMIVPLDKESDMLFVEKAIMGIDPDHCMINAIDFGYVSMEKWPYYKYYLTKFPVWQTESLDNDMIEAIKRIGKYGYLPTLPNLKKYFENYSKYFDDDARIVVQNLVGYLDYAAENIHKHVLKNVSCELW